MYRLIIAPTLAAAGTFVGTDANFQAEVMEAGRDAFVKFYAPWCGHCKRLAPVWDELADEHNGGNVVTIVDVDCTAEGKDTCSKHGVRGFPTIKYFTEGNGEDGSKYEGGRDKDALNAFIAKTFASRCDVDTLAGCNDEDKKVVTNLKGKSKGDIEGLLQKNLDDLKSKRDGQAVNEIAFKAVEKKHVKEQQLLKALKKHFGSKDEL